MLEQIFENFRQSSPLAHNMTNHVTVNDCANMLPAFWDLAWNMNKQGGST